MADLGHMNELMAQSAAVSFRAEGDPPELYHVMISAPGLARDENGRLRLRNVHRCAIYLHSDYPRRPPVVTWLTPILHPNILGPDRNGGVCLGSWSPSESLADVVRRLVDLVSYRAFNASDALDNDAARWIIKLGVEPGVDVQSLLYGPGADATEEVVVSLGRNRPS
jgi:ubiquitin-protein ligase